MYLGMPRLGIVSWVSVEYWKGNTFEEELISTREELGAID
jgi:hypothetical protein